MVVAVLSLADAKKHLNITKTDDDVELQTVIDAATAAIEGVVGPIAARTITATVRPPHQRRYASSGFNGLDLPVAPALSLTSVTPAAGTALDVSLLYLDQYAGLVSYADTDAYSSTYRRFPAISYTVIYTAGRATGDPGDPYPADLVLAVKELVRHIWASQRGAGVRRPGSAPSETLNTRLPGAAYTFPIRVTELLSPHTLPTVG